MSDIMSADMSNLSGLETFFDPERSNLKTFLSLNTRLLNGKAILECTSVFAHFVGIINFENAKQKFKSSSNNGVLLLWKGFRKGVAARNC